MTSQKQTIEALLEPADVKINGSRPWDIKVNRERFYRRVLREGSLGIGESYIDGDWDCQAIDELATRVLEADIPRQLKSNPQLLWHIFKSRLFNLSPKSKAYEIGETHYDIGNDLYQAMLDKRLTYTCGYWGGSPPAKNLDQAQEVKLDLVCHKIGLKKGDRVLDIGGGWGGFGKFAAEKYGASVVNITVSKEQVALANKLCRGLPVENRLQDYRDLDSPTPEDKFDHIVSLGMFEHVGYKNYRTYMEIVQRNLKDDGLFFLQTIGRNTSTTTNDPWGNKYIFPNSMLPSIKQIGQAIEDLFVMEDWHNLRADYDKTLMAWYRNFEAAWPKLKAKYGERFYRMWRLYLLGCAGGARSDNFQLWQIILSPKGVPGGYRSVRSR